MSRIVTIRLPEWLLEKLDQDAADAGVSRTEFIKKLYISYKQDEAELEEYINAMAAESGRERS